MREMVSHPFGPVTVQVERDLLIRLCAASREVCEDLEAELQARYPGDRPAEARRLARDMDVVVRMRDLTSQIRAGALGFDDPDC